VAGLVAITPASGFVGPMAALVIGTVAGVICYCSCAYLKHKLGYDDSLDIFGVHGIGGTTGAILTGVFASTAVNPAAADGLLRGNPGQFMNQLLAVGLTWVFSMVMSIVIAKVVSLFVGLRVGSEDEILGLDVSQHGESGYALGFEATNYAPAGDPARVGVTAETVATLLPTGQEAN
jgi:Amt family ammonium transporter